MTHGDARPTRRLRPQGLADGSTNQGGPSAPSGSSLALRSTALDPDRRDRRHGRHRAADRGARPIANWSQLAPRRAGQLRRRSAAALAGVNIAQLAVGVLGVLLVTRGVRHRHDPLDVRGDPDTAAGDLGQVGVFARRIHAHGAVGLHRVPRRGRRLRLGTTTVSTLSAPARGTGGVRRRALPDRDRRPGRRDRVHRPQHRRRHRRVRRLLLVLPGLGELLPESIETLLPYLPTGPGRPLARRTRPGHLAPWTGFGVLCLWTVVALAIAAGAGRPRRDV